MEDLTVVSGDKDSYLALSRCAVLKIAEFEKTAKTEVSIIKDMVTKPFTTLRAPYGKGAKKRACRCSFISSSNNSDLLRDSTGATRFIILDLEKIVYKYPVRSDNDGLQLLAQARYLAESNFKSDKDTEEKLDTFLLDRTPDDPSEDILDSYSRKIEEYLTTFPLIDQLEIRQKGWIENSLMIKLVKEIAEECDIKERTVRVMLRVAGLGIKSGGSRGYLLPKVLRSSVSEEEILF
jgi:predicted P-loop ATPase